MKPLDFHLYLIFNLGLEFYAIDAIFVDKLYRFYEQDDETNFFLFKELDPANKKFSLIDLHRTVGAFGFVEKKSATLMTLNAGVIYHEAPVAAIVDYVCGIEQISPDDMNVLPEHRSRKNGFRPCIRATAMVEVKDSRRHEREVEVKILDHEAVFMHGIISDRMLNDLY
ncbi:MAG: hypothetical protein OEV66_11205 [Spirochaetia bacterium]|nr:hypothetical protein [Spirochaetia bacterium]